jgi:hypothetical protein
MEIIFTKPDPQWIIDMEKVNLMGEVHRLSHIETRPREY